MKINKLLESKRLKESYIVDIIYDSGKHKAQADDGVHGKSWVDFPEHMMNYSGQQYEVDKLLWNGTNYTVEGSIKYLNKTKDDPRVDGWILHRQLYKEGITNTEPVVKFQGKSSHTITKDNKWEVDVDEKGNILARTRHGKPSYFKGHINDKTNDFPSTDEDNIILAARAQYRLKFGNKEVKEGYSHFEFTSGSNPYIAKDEKEKNHILKKYGNKVKEIKPGFYKVDDSEKDLFRVDDLDEGSIPRNALKIRATDRMNNKSIDLYKHDKYWKDNEGEDYNLYDPAYLRKWNDIEVLETDPNYKPNRTKPEYVVQGNYGYGWEDLTASDDYSEARNDLKAYRENETGVPHRLITRRVPVTENLEESFKPSDSGIQSVKCYNRYNYTIQELRVDNDNKTFERGNFTAGKADKKTKNRQEFEDIVDTLKELGYTEIKSDYRSMRNKSRKGKPTNESYISSIESEQDDEFGDEASERFIKRLDEASEGFQKEFYCDYVILKSRVGDGWDIYSYDGTPEKVTKAYLEDEGFATLQAAKDEIDKWNDVEMNEASHGKNYRKSWSDDGSVYSQTYYISNDEYQEVLKAIENYKDSDYGNDNIYGRYDSLKNRLTAKDGEIYPGLTAARLVRDVLGLENFKFDRNVRFVINDKKSNASMNEASYGGAFDDDVDDLTYYYEDEVFKHNLETNPYAEIESKQVPDSDGFMTDYTMYMDMNTGEYVFIFGDKDVYCPDNGYFYFDWECETEEEAKEWFDNYNGFDESDDDIDWMNEEAEGESPILHKKADGSYLVASDDGYTAFNKSDECVGHISANNEQEAKNKFNSNQFDKDTDK